MRLDSENEFDCVLDAPDSLVESESANRFDFSTADISESLGGFACENKSDLAAEAPDSVARFDFESSVDFDAAAFLGSVIVDEVGAAVDVESP